MNITGKPAFLAQKEAEWSDQSMYIDGVRVAGIKGNSFGVSTDKKHLFGEGDTPLCIQSGNREPKGSFKLMKSVVDTLNLLAVSKGGRDMNDLVFDLVYVYQPQGTRPRVRVTLFGCQTMDFKYGWDQGSTEMMIDVPYLYMDIDVSAG
jgi:hypothetical protein